LAQEAMSYMRPLIAINEISSIAIFRRQRR